MALDLSPDSHFQRTLDPVRLNAQADAIAFGICAAYQMQSQQTTMQMQECWWAYASLHRFASALPSLLCADGEASAPLRDMDDRLALEVARKNTGLLVQAHAPDLAGQMPFCYLPDVLSAGCRAHL